MRLQPHTLASGPLASSNGAPATNVQAAAHCHSGHCDLVRQNRSSLETAPWDTVTNVPRVPKAVPEWKGSCCGPTCERKKLHELSYLLCPSPRQPPVPSPSCETHLYNTDSRSIVQTRPKSAAIQQIGAWKALPDTRTSTPRSPMMGPHHSSFTGAVVGVHLAHP